MWIHALDAWLDGHPRTEFVIRGACMLFLFGFLPVAVVYALATGS